MILKSTKISGVLQTMPVAKRMTAKRSTKVLFQCHDSLKQPTQLSKRRRNERIRMASNEITQDDEESNEKFERLRVSDASNDNDVSPAVPALFTSWPPLRDSLATDSSISQDETREDCLPHLDGSTNTLFDLNARGIPRLNRDKHTAFLRDTIQHARYIPYDAARPWVVYWSLTGLYLLGEDVEAYQKRYRSLNDTEALCVLY